MPILNNPRHEHFATLIASGLDPTNAYIAVGYSRKSAHASANRLQRNATVSARLTELKVAVAERTIEKAAVDRAWVVSRLMSNVERCRQAEPVIDREGKLAQRHVGLLNAEETELEAQVLAGLNTNARIERVDDPARVRLENAAQATSIPGVDLTKLSPAKRTEAIKALNAADCTCGCGLTLAECRINDPDCSTSLPIARKMVEQIAGTH